ncbi:unnamed protein product [Cladocopium goreaui]|uniref:WW domain-containing protein n=1 Tax=Cladocopium goreaui TaxID=2562237 RepID=A0A9P1GRT3_9DINO|nr:unnamed protein product [Cladocopium goreaui]
MAISMRFLAKASQSFESIVSHASSPKALRTPKTPKTPKTPMSPFGISPLASLNRVNFFPEDVEKVEKRTHKVPARSVHFADGATWVGNATRLLGGQLQPKAEASSPITDLTTAASATRDAVRARFARQEDRCVPTPPVAGLDLTLPVLLGHRMASTVASSTRATTPSDGNEESCAHAARKAFLEQQERRASRAMVDFVVYNAARGTEISGDPRAPVQEDLRPRWLRDEDAAAMLGDEAIGDLGALPKSQTAAARRASLAKMKPGPDTLICATDFRQRPLMFLRPEEWFTLLRELPQLREKLRQKQAEIDALDERGEHMKDYLLRRKYIVDKYGLRKIGVPGYGKMSRPYFSSGEGIRARDRKISLANRVLEEINSRSE